MTRALPLLTALVRRARAALLLRPSLRRASGALARDVVPVSLGRLLREEPAFPLRVGAGLAAGANTLLLRALLIPVLGQGEMLLPLFPLLVLASLYGGAAAASLCLATGLVGGWYLYMGRPDSFALATFEGGNLIGSLVVGLVIAGICVWLRSIIRALEGASAEQHLLARELEHRIRNCLTLVISINRNTYRTDCDIADATVKFEGRISALSCANRMMLGDAADVADLRGIIAKALAPFADGVDDGRVTLAGPDLPVGSKPALALALGVHELATNAVKYGALSCDTGRLAIAWRVEDARFILVWTERGGPIVAIPARRGFGTKLIERNLPSELEGRVALRFLPEGVHMSLDAPVGSLIPRGFVVGAPAA